MTEKAYITKRLRFLEDKIKRLEEEKEFRSWKIQGKKILIENKKSLLGQKSKESAAISVEINQKEQELKKARNATQTENAFKAPNVSLLTYKILSLKSRLEAVDKVNDKLYQEMEYHKKKLKELTNNVDDEALYHYKRLSDSKERNPIAQVIGNVCRGCFLNVTLQTLNSLKANDELVLCPNCKRVLFLSEDDQI
ncbi:MAG: zinc ribbon domain-containing protein [Planctomycetota bacterium]|jgi:predicted  nucleic acid-binding Zn-ribbon protein